MIDKGKMVCYDEQSRSTQMIIKLTHKNTQYPELTLGQPYVVIGIEANDYRILNDDGRPYLYPSRLFQIVDKREPDDWITEYGEDGERYSYPALLNESGFFEDFFENKLEAVHTFWKVVNFRLATMAMAA